MKHCHQELNVHGIVHCLGCFTLSRVFTYKIYIPIISLILVLHKLPCSYVNVMIDLFSIINHTHVQFIYLFVYNLFSPLFPHDFPIIRHSAPHLWYPHLCHPTPTHRHFDPTTHRHHFATKPGRRNARSD